MTKISAQRENKERNMREPNGNGNNIVYKWNDSLRRKKIFSGNTYNLQFDSFSVDFQRFNFLKKISPKLKAVILTKSTPMVLMCVSVQELSCGIVTIKARQPKLTAKRRRRQDFPTPESPINRILKKKSLEWTQISPNIPNTTDLHISMDDRNAVWKNVLVSYCSDAAIGGSAINVRIFGLCSSYGNKEKHKQKIIKNFSVRWWDSLIVSQHEFQQSRNTKVRTEVSG